MSSYDNFISDFPKRCDDILKNFFPLANARKREVTLMLAVATAGFSVPFERLRAEQHPARDRELFDDAARQFDVLLESPFLESPLWDAPAASWAFSNKIENIQQELDFWPELRQPKPLSKEKTTKSVLKHLRNALAHGNVFTRGNPIDLLVFLSRPSEDRSSFAMMAVTPSDLYQFLRKWFAFLGSLKMPTDVSEESIVA